MQGGMVIVRTFRGRPRVGRVWQYTPGVVVVVSEEHFAALTKGEEDPMLIGFPLDDVFRYDPAVLKELENSWQDNPRVWDRLVRWEAEAS